MSAADHLITAGKVAGALVSLWGAAKLALRVHRKIAKSVSDDVERRLTAQLTAQLAPIIYELRPNGGSSLADRVRAILDHQRLQAARHQALNRDAPMGMFESDRLGACIWVNRTYCRLTERTEQEVLGWNWLNSIHPDDVDDVQDLWRECVAEAREYMRTQRYLTPSGKEVLATVSASPVCDEAGQVLAYVGFVRPVHACDPTPLNCPLRRSTDSNFEAHHADT